MGLADIKWQGITLVYSVNSKIFCHTGHDSSAIYTTNILRNSKSLI